MRTALFWISIWLALSIPGSVALGQFFAGVPITLAARRANRKPAAPRVPWPLCWALCLALTALALSGCGGGGGTTAALAPVTTPAPPPTTSQGDPPPTTPPGPPNGTPLPTSPPLPACSTGTTTDLYISSCVCPSQYVNGSACIIPVAVLPQCPVGTTKLYITACQCPPTDVNGSSCVVPAPPTVTLSAVGPTQPAAPGSSFTLTWTTTNASTCLGSWNGTQQDLLPPAGNWNTGPLTTNTSYSLTCAGFGSAGNSTASVAIVVAVSITPNPPPCAEPGRAREVVCTPSQTPVLTESLTVTPTTVSDSSAGCPDPQGNPCVATVGINVTSSFVGDNTAGQILCYVGSDPTQYLTSPLGLGPYPAAQDGPVVTTVSCYDAYGATSSASVTLNVVPPAPNPVGDSFTEVNNGNDTYTFTWATTSQQGAGGCYVDLAGSNGVDYGNLPAGGGASGTAVSGTLPSGGNPYTATLLCSGAADASVPTFAVSF